MTKHDFDFIRKLLKDRCGIALEPGKQYLVETRLAPLLRQLNLHSISELVRQLRIASGNGLATEIVEAMVTTETLFFRDHAPFETLRKAVLPDLLARRAQERSLKIWCAGCSTGQEPYSLAIAIREYFPELRTWDLALFASDLSRNVIERALDGRYNQIEANRGMPAALLIKYFEQQGTSWQLKSDIRKMVQFSELNLAKPWPPMPRLDLVLLRNVMIYFDVETKKSILRRVGRLLRPDGYLLLGGAETTINLDDSYRRLEHLKSGFYQLAEGA